MKLGTVENEYTMTILIGGKVQRKINRNNPEQIVEFSIRFADLG